MEGILKSLINRIAINPRICHGQPCIRGTRIMISVILDNLAAGIPDQEILEAYPSLKSDDLRAALVYAAEITREDHVAIPIG
jgi:uncharacterized protein (DUF433 family)